MELHSSGWETDNNKQKIFHVVKVGLDKIKMSSGRVQFFFYIAPIRFNICIYDYRIYVWI